MPLRRVEASILVQAPSEDVFRWVADYRNASKALDGVRQWRPLDPARTTGRGARFKVRIAVFGITAGTTLEIDRWEEPRVIGWHADRGPVAVRGEWVFAGHPSGTDVRLTIAYDPPGGILGALGTRELGGLARRRLQAGLDTMRDAIEATAD
ncbi:MAG: SRPBCC family protein [Candidatus Dormibacteraceae bacterium]